MHCITVMYPKLPGTTFDVDYYLDVHVPLAFRELKRRFGVTPVRVDCFHGSNRIKGAEGGSDATDYHCIFNMYFGTRSDAERMIALRDSSEQSSEELREDIKAYTAVELRAVLSEVRSCDVSDLLDKADELLRRADANLQR